MINETHYKESAFFVGKNLTRKILEAHLAKPSDMKPGEEIYVKVDQTLTHDINLPGG